MTQEYRGPFLPPGRGPLRRRMDRQVRRDRSFRPLRAPLQPLEPRLLLTQGPSQISTYVASSPVNISNQSVAYSQNVQGASVRITSGLVPSEDRLLFTTQNNITGNYNTATGVLTLSGTASGTAYATALNSVKYSNTAADPGNGDRGFSVQLGTAVYNAGTGHYYEYYDFPASSLDWYSARSDASSRKNLGLTGYLATITSSAEQSFISSTFGGVSGWLGGRANVAGPNTWSWVTGPEGTQNGGGGFVFGSPGPIAGVYSNWDVANPTGSSSQTSVLMRSSGKWASLNEYSDAGGSFIEYGGLGSTPTFTDRWSGTIHVLDRTAPPSLSSPAIPTLVNATTYAINGTAPAGSLVQVFVDADNNGVADNPGSPAASQQLSAGVTSFSINTPLTQSAANNFVVVATAYAGANPSVAVDVPTITENAPPSLTSNNGSVSAPEGGSAANSGTFADPQGNNTVSLSASVGTVTPNFATGAWSWSLAAVDGPSGPVTVTITATDTFGAATQSTFTYRVDNVVPSISLAGATTVNEGSPFTLLLGPVSDPGTDTVTSYHINWGDGVVESFTGHPTGNSRNHTYSDGPFSRSYAVSVTDEDGTALAGGLSVLVLNVAPEATLTSTGPVTYGQTATLALTNPHDASGPDTTAGFHYAFSTTPGAANGFSGVTYANSSTNPTFDATRLSAGTHTFYARIIDKDEGFTEYSTDVIVGKAALTVTADDCSKTYGGTDPVLTYTPLGDLYYGDSYAVILGVLLSTATGTDATAGSHVISVSGATSENYEITTVNGKLSVAKANALVTINPYSGVYDGTAHGLTGSVAGVDAGGAVLGGVLSLGLTFTDAPGGTTRWVFDGGANYLDESGYAAVVIEKAAATVSVNGYSGTYDAAAHGATGTAAGVGGVDLSSGLSLGSSFTDAPGGTAHWTFDGGVNYLDQSGDVDIAIAKADAKFLVKPYLQVTYDGQAHTTLVTATGVGHADLSAGLDLSGTTHTNAGTYLGDTWVFRGGTNYNDATDTVNNSIDRADAEFSLVGYAVTYDGAAHTATGTATGVQGETLGGLDFSGTTHTNAGAYDGDTVTFTDVSGNYNNATLTISDSIAKAAATISVDGYSGTYDAEVHGLVGTAVGVNGEALGGLDLGVGRSDAGTSTVGWTFTGGGNYLDASGSQSIVIAPRPVSVTADAQTKSTGQADPDLTYRITAGSLAGDDGFTGSLTRQPGEAAGTYAILLGTLALGPNYELSFSGADLVITAATSSLSGTVFVDFNNDGQIDFGEKGVAGVTVRLTGTDDLGRAVDQVMQTDVDGAYVFRFLRPGAYRIEESQPAGYTQGTNALGTAGGTSSGDAFALTLAAEMNGLNYNFGERPSATGSLQRGQTAGIGFWNNRNGQALIKSLNGGPASTQLGDWLAATLPNLYGPTGGACNLAGKTNAQVAAFYQTRFVLKGTKVDAQVLATALSVYVTNATLDDTRVAENYGFTVTQYGVGATGLFNVGGYGSVFGLANNTTVTVLDLLLAVNARSANGVLFKGDTVKRLIADVVFGLINEIGRI